MTSGREGQQFRLLTVHYIMWSLAMSLASGFVGAYLLHLGFSIGDHHRDVCGVADRPLLDALFHAADRPPPWHAKGHAAGRRDRRLPVFAADPSRSAALVGRMGGGHLGRRVPVLADLPRSQRRQRWTWPAWAANRAPTDGQHRHFRACPDCRRHSPDAGRTRRGVRTGHHILPAVDDAAALDRNHRSRRRSHPAPILENRGCQSGCAPSPPTAGCAPAWRSPGPSSCSQPWVLHTTRSVYASSAAGVAGGAHRTRLRHRDRPRPPRETVARRHGWPAGRHRPARRIRLGAMDRLRRECGGSSRGAAPITPCS